MFSLRNKKKIFELSLMFSLIWSSAGVGGKSFTVPRRLYKAMG